MKYFSLLVCLIVGQILCVFLYEISYEDAAHRVYWAGVGMLGCWFYDFLFIDKKSGE